MFINDDGIFVVCMRDFITLLYERSNAFDCKEVEDMPLEFSLFFCNLFH